MHKSQSHSLLEYMLIYLAFPVKNNNVETAALSRFFSSVHFDVGSSASSQHATFPSVFEAFTANSYVDIP